MTSMTFTAPAPTGTIPAITLPFGFKKFGRFVAVFFGVNADKCDHFRGLDLNGNAMWSRQAIRTTISGLSAFDCGSPRRGFRENQRSMALCAKSPSAHYPCAGKDQAS